MITPGALLLALATLLAGGAHVAPASARALLARLHATAVLLAFAWMLVAFVTSDLGLAYVWDHTRDDYALPYRIAGIWGGEQGTLLLWNAAISVFLLVVLRRDGVVHRRAASFLAAMSGALALVNLLSGAFDATEAAKVALAPHGRGLADVLLTPLMVIHPPIQFIGYALMSVPAAYALAHWWARDETPAWAHPAYAWARVAWLFATLGLGLGALWAYYVLSFGGYWAWDPVETSNLLPWLALTAFLHAGKQLVKHGDHALAAAVLAFVAHVLTLFATFATRSGLWVSVHAFTDPTNRFEPDAGARLLAILDAHAESRLLLGLLSATLLGGAALLSFREARGPALRAHGALLLALGGAAALDPAFVWGLALQIGAFAPFGLALVGALLLGAPLAVIFLRADEGRRKAGLDARTLMSVAVALLTIALVVAFLLDAQVVNAPERRLFDERAPLVVLPIALAITVAMALPVLGARGALSLAGAGALLGAGGYLLFPSARVLALSAPILAAGAVAALLRLARAQGEPASTRLRLAGLLTGAGSILALLMWGNPPTWIRGLAVPEGLSLSLGVAGVAAGAVGLVGAFSAWRARSLRWALAGALATMLAAGYGIGALLGLAALALLIMERARFAVPPARGAGARLRETGVYLIHFALLAGLLGYAASTYSQDRQLETAVPLGETVHVGSHDLVIAQADVREDAGAIASVTVPVRVDDGGTLPMRFAWQSGPGAHYVGALTVRRGLGEDLYLSPLAFHTASGWVGANSAGAQAPAGTVDAVSFSVSALPLVSLVWSGLWSMILGMLLVLAGGALERRRAQR